MHHRTIQIVHQSHATIFQFIILTFIYSSTCFGRSPAHHQELNNCSSSLWFYLRTMVIAVLYSWLGRLKPEAATDVVLLMMGGRTPKTCWAVNKRQDNKLKNCCIWLVIYLNCNLQFFAPFSLFCVAVTYFIFFFASYKSARFLVLKALLIKMQVFWDTKLCKFVNMVVAQY